MASGMALFVALRRPKISRSKNWMKLQGQISI